MDDTARVSQSVEVRAGPARAFELYTGGINRWWKDSCAGTTGSGPGLRIEPFVGGRFVEVFDEDTGEGFEIGRVRVRGARPAGRLPWRQADWPAGEEMEIEVRFERCPPARWSPSRSGAGEGLTGGLEIGRGYGEGAKELLTWYAEAAASPG